MIMNICKKCGIENLETAIYCKECGRSISKEVFLDTIKFKRTNKRVHPILRYAFPILIICIFIHGIFQIINNISSTKFEFVVVILLITFFIGILFGMLCFYRIFFFFLNLYYKTFELKLPFEVVKEQLKKVVFTVNKSKEDIRIKENAKGELKLKDKSLGAKGYFHLIEDKDGNAVLIGEKYNTQAFIRSVFGKDVNFIEN